jgi:hypothetical protein
METKSDEPVDGSGDGSIGGSCLCGAVAYRVRPRFQELHYCHCANCRKGHGAAHAAYAAIAHGDFELTRGADRVRRYRSSPPCERGFCGTCGSNLTYTHEAVPGLMWIALGTLDGDPGQRPQAHIFVRSRAPWHDITDQLPQHEDHLPLPGA